MKFESIRSSAFILGLITAVALSAQEAQLPTTPMDEARVTVENRADADGYIRLRITPADRDPINASVPILRRMSENDIAADIEKALILAVGDEYSVDRRGGENVRIRKADRDATPDFVLEIAFSAPGLAITMH